MVKQTANNKQKKGAFVLHIYIIKAAFEYKPKKKKRFLLAKTKSDKLKSSSHTLFAAFSKHTNKKKRSTSRLTMVVFIKSIKGGGSNKKPYINKSIG